MTPALAGRTAPRPVNRSWRTRCKGATTFESVLLAISFPVVQSGNQDIDGVLWGWRWSSNQANGHTVLTFSFPTSAADYLGYTSIQTFEAFNAQQEAAARKILAMYDSVCNVDLV